MHLLLAEDERELSNALVAILQYNHYTVDAVYNGQDALDYLSAGGYDIAILDVMMPLLDGIEVLRRLRAGDCRIPVLMLTARSEIGDRVEGLDAGADDYLAKPFATEELLARLRALTRRPASFAGNVLAAGNLTLNRATFEMATAKGAFRLGSKEFQLMEMLLQNRGHLISADRFLDKIWGYDSPVEVNVVWVYLSYLRKKLLALDATVRIKAVRNIGYVLEDTP